MEKYDITETRDLHIPDNNYQSNALIRQLILEKNTKLIGFACQWKSEASKCFVALIQISTATDVVLFQTCNFQSAIRLPWELVDLLENQTVIKVGVNIEEFKK